MLYGPMGWGGKTVELKKAGVGYISLQERCLDLLKKNFEPKKRAEDVGGVGSGGRISKST